MTCWPMTCVAAPKLIKHSTFVKRKVVVYEADGAGYWAQVLGCPACPTHGENFEELLENIYEAGERTCLCLFSRQQRSFNRKSK